jgi:hypothetical protein
MSCLINVDFPLPDSALKKFKDYNYASRELYEAPYLLRKQSDSMEVFH